ncbi:J domain-containing protein [Pseudomonas sp. NPDC089534]|uniref:J domain-containing protein n=1 Tax=Pseudomonas sp. NPDC089534 TaxID=3364468 RepID=UPI0038274497
MDCWSVLQLPDDAGTRDIKRSYARLLKACRPDEDAEGFQRLREAYEQALAVARWREEYEANELDGDVMVAAPAGLGALSAERPLAAVHHPHRAEHDGSDVSEAIFAPANPSAPENAYPLETLRAEPVESAAGETLADPTLALAATLADGLSPDNLAERWEQAGQLGCAKAFEKRLLQLCFDQPSIRLPLASWALEHLGWLGPWQDLDMADWQRNTLANTVMVDYQYTLMALLEEHKEREFLALLKSYSAQPWLQVFDRREQWQQTLLHVLEDSEWSVPLFERIAQVFGWDDTRGLHPQPDSVWRALIERCNQESFYDNLRAKAEGRLTSAPDVQAAHLLINPLKPSQQKRMIDSFGANEWQACQHLSETLKWRYPELLARLPYADVFYWRRFLPRYIASETWVRVWVAVVLALWLFFIPTEHKSPAFTLVMPLVFACVPTWFFYVAMSWWVPIIAYAIVADLWLTENLIPRRWNPDTRWLVIRHGVPQAAMVLLFSVLLGKLGAISYIGTMLIGLCHKRRIGSLDPELSNRRPWLTALHWAHFSPLQVLFLLVMVAVTFAARSGFTLERLMPG